MNRETEEKRVSYVRVVHVRRLSVGHGRWCGQERVGHARGEGTRRHAPRRAAVAYVASGRSAPQHSRWHRQLLTVV